MISGRVRTEPDGVPLMGLFMACQLKSGKWRVYEVIDGWSQAGGSRNLRMTPEQRKSALWIIDLVMFDYVIHDSYHKTEKSFECLVCLMDQEEMNRLINSYFNKEEQ